MIPEVLQQAIFKSIPKEVVYADKAYSVGVEYAEMAQVSDMLKDYPLVLTLRYFGEAPVPSLTPSNRILEIDTSETMVSYRTGEMEKCVLSMNVYSHPDEKLAKGTLIRAYLEELIGWYYQDLKQYTSVLGRSPIDDLSFLSEGSLRKHMDVEVVYPVGYLAKYDTIADVDPTLEIKDR